MSPGRFPGMRQPGARYTISQNGNMGLTMFTRFKKKKKNCRKVVLFARTVWVSSEIYYWLTMAKR